MRKVNQNYERSCRKLERRAILYEKNVFTYFWDAKIRKVQQNLESSFGKNWHFLDISRHMKLKASILNKIKAHCLPKIWIRQQRGIYQGASRC